MPASPWDKYLNDSRDGHAEMIARSWRRSTRAGSTANGAVFHRVSPEELARRLELTSWWLPLASAETEKLSHALRAKAHVAYVVGDKGIVLFSAGNDEIQQAYGLLPGFDWSERRMGTNGAGTALAERKPVAIVGREHYCATFVTCTCMAAPLFDRDGRLLGAIDVSMAEQDARPADWKKVIAAAARVTTQLAQRDRRSAPRVAVEKR